MTRMPTDRQTNTRTGSTPIKLAFATQKGLLCFVFFVSVFINLLGLTGPIFMLQVYDRVLSSRSEETLVALFILVAFLFLCLGGLEYFRSTLLARRMANVQHALKRSVLDADVNSGVQTKARDALRRVARFALSPASSALFDLPWTPFFLIAIAIFHPVLGVSALFGALLLIGIAILGHVMTAKQTRSLIDAEAKVDRIVTSFVESPTDIWTTGVRKGLVDRCLRAETAAIETGLAHLDQSRVYLVSSKMLRLFFQSAILAIGAYLVLQSVLSAGAMIAASILFGRAMAPVEAVISQWSQVQAALNGRKELNEFLGHAFGDQEKMELPRPDARLNLKGILVKHADNPVLKFVNLEVGSSECIGVVGTCGSGKSTLLKAATGALPLTGGEISLGEAGLQQYPKDALASHIGYLPQRIQLYEGTIAENIARMTPEFRSEDVVTAAQKAGAHRKILSLPEGYQTFIRNGGEGLSGGEIQLIGLARAFYGNPVLLILDEPDSNLDKDSSQLVTQAILRHKLASGAALLVTHRPALLSICDRVVKLQSGQLHEVSKVPTTHLPKIDGSLDMSKAIGGHNAN